MPENETQNSVPAAADNMSAMEAHQQYEDSTKILSSAELQPWCHNLSETSGQKTINLQLMTSVKIIRKMYNLKAESI